MQPIDFDRGHIQWKDNSIKEILDLSRLTSNEGDFSDCLMVIEY